jgi:hypothetical protein
MSWQDFVTRHDVGDVIEGVVTAQVPFGSFVESDGCTGLAYQQSWPRRRPLLGQDPGDRPGEAVQPGRRLRKAEIPVDDVTTTAPALP